VSFLEQISHDHTSAASSNSHRTVHIYFGVGHQPVQGTISELQSLTGGPRDQGKGQLTPEAPLLEWSWLLWSSTGRIIEFWAVAIAIPKRLVLH